MGIPVKQAYVVGKYILTQRLRGRKRHPLVLMLEPLYRCNLACAGCGKIQQPEEMLRAELRPEQCFAAAEECGAPVVSIAGGEPLLHPRIAEITAGLLQRGRVVYLCTNGLLLRRMLDRFRPEPGFNFNVHLDGGEEAHDRGVRRAGVYRTAVAGIRAAKDRGFRVTVNCTVFAGQEVASLHAFFDEMTSLGVDGIMIAPAYAYAGAADQGHFLGREEARAFFRQLLAPARRRGWRFNHSPFYLDFLEGKVDYQCTAWGSPSYGIAGWQRPCYLLQDGQVETFRELMEGTDWERYGPGRNPACADCLMHCGYEPTAVEMGLSTPRNALRALRSAL